MVKFSSEYLTILGQSFFEKIGAPKDEAYIVANNLVETSLMGIDSHGIMRYRQYVDETLKGIIKPGASIKIISETNNSAIVDCGWNYGIVGATRITEIAFEIAKKGGISIVTSRHCHHIGRLGAYVQYIAERGMFSFAVVNSSRHGHWTAPWGGRNGRLATNPLAYAAPTSSSPVVFDMSTSMIAEGKIRILMQQGEKIPAACILDYYGNPTTDPDKFYKPRKGTILPFGNQLGYKGFGLGLLVEIMGSTLSGLQITPEGERDDYINGFTIIVIDPSIYGNSTLIDDMDILKDYITSCPVAPGFNEVVMPGEYDFRTRDKRLKEGIPVTDKTWRSIQDTAKKIGVAIR